MGCRATIGVGEGSVGILERICIVIQDILSNFDQNWSISVRGRVESHVGEWSHLEVAVCA